MPTCGACGAENLDIDVRCVECGKSLASTGAHRLVGSVMLGQYRITDIIGQGGMSVVYLARHALTDQEVALKILPPELAAHAQVKSRFLEEARALAQLDHPNVVHLYNFGQENGSFVLAMQYIHGHTFERLILDAGQVDWRLAAKITVDVLRALDYAHGRGIVHRDMKPSNILVRDDDGTATVMDFGIAKMTNSSKLTATGQTMGTVRYMSPEQVRGQVVDGRTDLYSLGVALYEAVVGDTPFDGETHFDIMTKHLTEPPPSPSSLGVKLPPALETLILRALQKRPEDRIQTAREFLTGIEGVLVDGAVGEATTQRSPTGAPPAAVRRSAPGAAPAPELALVTSVLDVPGENDAAEVTGLVSAPRARSRTWAALAGAAVLVAAGVVAVVLWRGGAESRLPPAAPTGPTAPAPRWPAAFRLPGLAVAAERTWPEAELRILSAGPRDLDELRAACEQARTRFRALLAARGVSEPLEPLPLNLVVVPPRAFCDRRLYESGEVPSDCLATESWYRPGEKTLYLADNPRLIAVSVPYGIALQQCLHAQVKGCEDALEAFDAELSGSP